jgi:hypothetical protein
MPKVIKPKTISTEPIKRPRNVLFELYGTEYTIPAKVTAGESIQHRINVLEQGVEFALIQACRRLISDGGFNKLLAAEDIPDKAVEAVILAVASLLTGEDADKSGDRESTNGAVDGKDSVVGD